MTSRLRLRRRRSCLAIASTLAALVAGPGSAAAQPVYRCGNAYSQAPCPIAGRLVDATDPRTAAQRAEAHRVAADEQRRAERMRSDRLADESARRPARASSLSGPAASASAADRSQRGKHPKAKRRAAAVLLDAQVDAASPADRKR